MISVLLQYSKVNAVKNPSLKQPKIHHHFIQKDHSNLHHPNITMTYYTKWGAVICYKLGSWDLKLMNWCTLNTLHVQQFFLCFRSKNQELTGWLILNEFSLWPWVLHEFNQEFFFMDINFNEFSSWPWLLYEFNQEFFFMAINFNFLQSHELTIIPT